jgi:ribulose-phosphate 3-epimerase
MLAADQSRLGEECRALEAAGADRVQWDVMDGRFVPNLTVGPDVVAACRAVTALPFEVHLMVADPDPLLHRWVEAGCELVIVHAETAPHLHRTLGRVRELGARAGLALNPHTPPDVVGQVLDLVDLVLVMTVNPGFGGQRYLASMEPKLRRVRELLDGADAPVELEVDGGVTAATIGGAAEAGADVFISGSWLFGHAGGLAAGMAQLRSLAERASVSASARTSTPTAAAAAAAEQRPLAVTR